LIRLLLTVTNSFYSPKWVHTHTHPDGIVKYTWMRAIKPNVLPLKVTKKSNMGEDTHNICHIPRETMIKCGSPGLFSFLVSCVSVSYSWGKRIATLKVSLERLRAKFSQASLLNHKFCRTNGFFQKALYYIFTSSLSLMKMWGGEKSIIFIYLLIK